jgi:type IV pilus biogenesis protein CpaD/CtpE
MKQTQRSLAAGVIAAAALLALAGCERRPATPTPTTGATPDATAPMAPASAASR